MLKTRVDNAALLRLIWGLAGGGSMINILGLQVPSSVVINQATADALGTAIKGLLNAGTYKTHLSNGVTLEAVGVRDIRNIDQPEFLDGGAAILGTGTGDTLARQVSLCVTLRTARAGREGRGRVYLGGFDEIAEDADGTASAALVLDAGTFMAGIRAAITAQGLNLAVVGRNRLARTETKSVTNTDGTTSTETKSYPASAGHVEPVTAIEIRNDIWDSQRRRTTAGSVSTFSSRPLFRYTAA